MTDLLNESKYSQPAVEKSQPNPTHHHQVLFISLFYLFYIFDVGGEVGNGWISHLDPPLLIGYMITCSVAETCRYNHISKKTNPSNQSPIKHLPIMISYIGKRGFIQVK